MVLRMDLIKLNINKITKITVLLYIFSTALNPFFDFKYIRVLADIILLFLFFNFLFNLSLKKVNLTKLDIIILLFMFQSIIGMIYAKYGTTAFIIKGFYTGYFPILGYFLGRLYEPNIKEEYINSLFKFILLLGVISIIWGIRQFIYPFSQEINYSFLAGTGGRFYGDLYERPENTFRIFSVFISSVHFAQFLLFLQIILFYLKEIQKINRKMFIFINVIIFIAITLSFSRTYYITYIVLIIFYYIKTYKSYTALIYIMIFIILFNIMLQIPIVKYRYGTLINPMEVSSFKTRLKLWEYRIEDIKKEFIFGYGTGVAGFHMRYPFEEYLVCDNLYLKILIELGIVGFFIFLLMYICITKYFSNYNNNPINMILIYHFILLVPMFTNQLLEAFPTNFLFFFLMGLVISFNKLASKKNQKSI